MTNTNTNTITRTVGMIDWGHTLRDEIGVIEDRLTDLKREIGTRECCDGFGNITAGEIHWSISEYTRILGYAARMRAELDRLNALILERIHFRTNALEVERKIEAEAAAQAEPQYTDDFELAAKR
jgi:hypothetical protein